MSSNDSSASTSQEPEFKPYIDPISKKPAWTDGDVTLVSSDGFIFKADKLALQYHSIAFQEMLDLELTGEMVKLEEDSITLDMMLRALTRYGLDRIFYEDDFGSVEGMMVYYKTDMEDLNFLHSLELFNRHTKLLKAAQKYQLDNLLPHYEDFFVKLAKGCPDALAHDVFVLGCNEGWEMVCKGALRVFGTLRYAGGAPWEWPVHYIKSISTERFQDFLVAFSATPVKYG